MRRGDLRGRFPRDQVRRKGSTSIDADPSDRETRRGDTGVHPEMLVVLGQPVVRVQGGPRKMGKARPRPSGLRPQGRLQ